MDHKLKKFARKFYWNLPFWLFKRIYRYRNHDNHKDNIYLSKRLGFYKVSDKNNFAEIYLAKRERLHKYHASVIYRLHQIYSEYLLDKISFSAGDTVIDIGSNIGEVSMSIAREHKGISFVCIEPSIDEAECCDLNVFNGENQTKRLALWSEDAVLDFYHKNETGDSSLLPADYKLKKTLIEAKSLDTLCRDLGLKEIKLLKLEAEGAEPEVLIGASKTLKQTKYVAADLGPERGPDKDRTYLECLSLLANAGFVEIGSHRGLRETYLFKNSNLN